MKKKQFILSLITICLVAAFSFTYTNVGAKDFAGQEDKYIKLCSSSKLSKSQQKTCKEFNTYLSNKNKKLSQDAKDTKKDVKDTQDSIEDIATKITEIEDKMSSAHKEISYIQKSIDNLNKQITTKSKQLEEHIYSMQTTMNSHMYISYIFGAESFTDFFSRIINFKEITSYNNDLIQQMNDNLAEVSKQQATLKDLESSLEKDKASQASLQKKFQAKLLEQNKELAANSSEISKNQESMDAIRSNLAAIQKASNESKVSNVTQATPNQKPSKPSNNNSSNNNQNSKPSDNSQNNNTDNSQNNNTDNSQNNDQSNDDLSSSEKLGLKIANKALTRQGYMYVWGGAHSWSSIKNPNWTQFDCSGLVNWAHYQAGAGLSRIHYTGSLLSAGKSISKSQLQAGDIILFSSNGSSSGVHHVGIYIGGNKMVHAPTEGQPVQVSNLSNSYWQREWYSCRRLY